MTLPERRRPMRRKSTWSLAMLAASGFAALFTASMADPASAQAVAEPPPVPESLRGQRPPEPGNLAEFVANRAEAIALGKALFWDIQLGSDNKTSCASCHFHAGADNRGRNQVSPGLNRMASPTQANPDTTFQLARPNATLNASHFPLHQFANPADRNSAVLRSVNDPVTSAGVINERFQSIASAIKPGGTLATATAGAVPTDPFANWYSSTSEHRTVVPDPVFHVGGINTRRVEPRNSPTVINAGFNLRNFWDGRAEWVFNGVNPFGLRDTNARVWKNQSSATGWSMAQVAVRLENASLASQASGPPGSDFEMSAAGRTMPDIGRKMLYLRPLQLQRVHPADSVLGTRVHSSGVGLSAPNYADMVQRAFRPEWWNGSDLIQVGAGGTMTKVPFTPSPAPNQYTQMQANFSLFFGLALQLYQATLVSDDAPFDRMLAGNANAMSESARQGLGVFFGKGKCAACHGGPEFTNASTRKLRQQLLSRMVMGDGAQAVYDEGFYNIGVTPTLEDLGVGGNDPFGNPLAISAVAQQGASRVNQLLGFSANLAVSPTERITRFGAFKTPTVRNAELTAPYFHNGDSLTLRQVVELYNRGGNFANLNRADFDADIQPLGLTEGEIVGLVEFMKSLTDDRVRYHRAPFDHPELPLPDGHEGNDAAVVNDGSGRARDTLRTLPAVGASGYAANQIPANFLNTGFSDQPIVEIRTSSGTCLGSNMGNIAVAMSTLVAAPCQGAGFQRFKIQAGDEGSVALINQSNGTSRIDAWYGASGTGLGVLIYTDRGSTDQHWRLEDIAGDQVRIRNRVGQCLEHSTFDNLVRSRVCSESSANQRFRFVRVGSNGTTEPNAPAAETWVRCASQGGVCNFTGTTTVRYVDPTRSLSGTATGTTLTFCLPHMFGLAFYSGTTGYCEYRQQ